MTMGQALINITYLGGIIMDFKDLAGKTGARYLRKSREDVQAEARGEGETLSKHRNTLSEFAEKWKLNVIDSFEEIVSGEKIAYRPEVQKLLTNVDDNKYQFVLCVDLDRLGRGDMRDQGEILNSFKESDTVIITPRKIYDLSNEMDEEWSEFESFMARRELKIITRRLQAGRISSVRDGKYLGANTPFGYDRNDNKILIQNDDAKIVRMIFDWYTTGDSEGNPMGSTKIADKLNEIGIKSPLLKQTWIPSTVLKILKNEVYIGRIQWKKTFRNKKEGIQFQKDRADWIDVKGQHEPIIDTETFEKARYILEQNPTPQTKTKQLRNPLAGLVICKGCGKKMVMQGNTGRNKKRITMMKCVTPECTFTSSSFKRVEDQILEDVKIYLQNLIFEKEKVLQDIKSDTPMDNPYPKLIEEAEKKLKALEGQENELDTLLEKKIYTLEKYIKRSEIISADILKFKEILVSLADENNKIGLTLGNIEKEIEIVTNVYDLYTEESTDIITKNKLLKSIIMKIYYIRRNRQDKFDTEPVFKGIK